MTSKGASNRLVLIDATPVNLTDAEPASRHPRPRPSHRPSEPFPSGSAVCFFFPFRVSPIARSKLIRLVSDTSHLRAELSVVVCLSLWSSEIEIVIAAHLLLCVAVCHYSTLLQLYRISKPEVVNSMRHVDRCVVKQFCHQTRPIHTHTINT